MVLLQNVSKPYRLYPRPMDRLREIVPGSRCRHTDFWALRDLNFQVDRGETLGVIGPNGCGKSTLLQVVSGILQPTSGRVVTRGRVAALLELGAELEVDFRMEWRLTPQAYTLTVATQNADGTSHDWLDDAVAFEVVNRRAAAGVANLRARVEWRVSR